MNTRKVVIVLNDGSRLVLKGNAHMANGILVLENSLGGINAEFIIDKIIGWYYK